MLKAQHNSQNHGLFSFNTENQSAIEIASAAYKKVNGWEHERAFVGFPADVMLEIIDSIRIPLESKKIDGEPLSHREESYLSMMEFLTDGILNSIAPIPEEPIEVRMALLHAKRIAQRG